MITFIVLTILFAVFLVAGLCFHLVGGILKLAFKLIFCLPCAILCGVVGIVLCCTLICIPLGLACFKLMGILINPFRWCLI